MCDVYLRHALESGESIYLAHSALLTYHSLRLREDFRLSSKICTFLEALRHLKKFLVWGLTYLASGYLRPIFKELSIFVKMASY